MDIKWRVTKWQMHLIFSFVELRIENVDRRDFAAVHKFQNKPHKNCSYSHKLHFNEINSFRIDYRSFQIWKKNQSNSILLVSTISQRMWTRYQFTIPDISFCKENNEKRKIEKLFTFFFHSFNIIIYLRIFDTIFARSEIFFQRIFIRSAKSLFKAWNSFYHHTGSISPSFALTRHILSSLWNDEKCAYGCITAIGVIVSIKLCLERVLCISLAKIMDRSKSIGWNEKKLKTKNQLENKVLKDFILAQPLWMCFGKVSLKDLNFYFTHFMSSIVFDEHHLYDGMSAR